jgi:hypothetical protein
MCLGVVPMAVRMKIERRNENNAADYVKVRKKWQTLPRKYLAEDIGTDYRRVFNKSPNTRL